MGNGSELRRAFYTVCAAVALLICSLSAKAAVYRFTTIAARGSVFSTFGNWPSINNLGDVAFNTILADNTTYAVYVGDGSSTRQIYAVDPGSIQNGPTINDSGWVAFGAYTGSNNVWISNGTTMQFVHSGIVVSPSINNATHVAFSGDVGSGRSGVGLWENGTTTWIADATNDFSSVSEPVLNDYDTVTFMGQDWGTANTAIYRGTIGGLSRVIGLGDVIRAGQTITAVGNRPTIDDNGRIVDWMDDSGGVEGLYAFEADGSIQTIATNQGPFKQFTTVYGSRAAIDGGTGLLFSAVLDDGRTGIFTGPDPVNDKIIATGDTLFGRTVSNVVLGYAGLNDSGQVAFQVLFSDGGGNLIVRADPLPEPSTGLLLVGVLMGITLGQRRLRHRALDR